MLGARNWKRQKDIAGSFQINFLSSDLGTHNTFKARIWLWLGQFSEESLEKLLSLLQVTGNCGILEAMLTGESNPVTKITDVCPPKPETLNPTPQTPDPKL